MLPRKLPFGDYHWISCILDVTILLYICRAVGGSTLITLAIPCINGATGVTQHHLHGYGCTVCFNFWYVNLITGLRSCGNQPPCSWLILKLLSLHWVKNYKWSHWKPFLWPIVFCWAIMFYFMAKPSALGILCGLCFWKNNHGVHKWHSILK